MFVRFRATRERLQVSLIETRRANGTVRHEHIASFGSIVMPPSIADRIQFWNRLHQRLAKLSNRVDAERQGKVFTAVHARIPMPTIDEQRALQLDNAKADAGFWTVIRDAHGEIAQGHKGLIASAERIIAKSEAEAAKADAEAKASQERIERIERGEEVSGGLGRPMTYEEMEARLLALGLTKQDIRDCEETHEISEAGLFDVLLAEMHKRREVAEKAAKRHVLRQSRESKTWEAD